MSSSNASSCIMGCWSAPRLFKNLTKNQRTGNEILLCSRELQEQLGLDGRKVYAFENKFGWPLRTVTRSYNFDRIKSSTGFLAADEL